VAVAELLCAVYIWLQSCAACQPLPPAPMVVNLQFKAHFYHDVASTRGQACPFSWHHLSHWYKLVNTSEQEVAAQHLHNNLYGD
jgi:hypothetical protein